ncbi:expressed unknown protein [Seminavis robusta]|uniref:Uncharacterized protein n=1 Tax=Seminavis robusta TaxID=568900 RepID=A0A9N8H1S8_9STRA|nr:expressed unknown protein [Seminavis robusta]|eukprot:Sro48_g028121.1  (594) ;mRNA; f:33684-35465
MVPYRRPFNLKNLLGLIQQALIVAFLCANVKPANGQNGNGGSSGPNYDCSLTLQDGSTLIGNDINNVDGVTFSTAGTLTCNAVSPARIGPCHGATISFCLSVVCNSNACQNADLSRGVEAVECKDIAACYGAKLPAISTMTLQNDSSLLGNAINSVTGVTISTAGTLTCEATSRNNPGPCNGATISNCLIVVCESNACRNADLSTIDAVLCQGVGACDSAYLPALCTVTYPDGATSIGAAIGESDALVYDASTNSLTCRDCDGLTISGCSRVVSPSVCTLFRPDGIAYSGAALSTLADVEFHANTNSLTCKEHNGLFTGLCKYDISYNSPTISGCSQLICEKNACWGAEITGIPSIECTGFSACDEATIKELPNDALVKCEGNKACLNTEITAAVSSSGSRVICDGQNACTASSPFETIINVDCLECKSSDACLKNPSTGCEFHGALCQDGPQGSCPCSLTMSTGEVYLEQDINTLTDVSYDSNANSILCEGQLQGQCRDGTIMACPTVECSTRACKGTTVWKPNDLDCVGLWACKEAVLKELPSGATAACNGDRACVDAEFTTEEGQGGVTVDCIDIGSQACLRATLDGSSL